MRFLIYLCLLPLGLAAQPGYQELFQAGMQARDSGDEVNYLRYLRQANELRPLHPTITFRVGTALIRNNHKGEGMDWLRKSLMLNAGLPLEEEEDLGSIRGEPAYMGLLSFRDSLLQSVITGQVIMTLPERDLHVEGLAYDAVNEEWYFGSVHKRKIIRRSKFGEVSVFKDVMEDGLMAVMDLEIDAQRRLLWLSSVPAREMIHYDDKSGAAIYCYDLSTGSLIDKYQPDQSDDHWYGDLALDSAGRLFVNDSFTNNIYTVDQGEMTLWFEGREIFGNLQGIGVSGTSMIVSDYLNSLYRIDLITRSVERLENPYEELILKGTDGVAIKGNDLLVVINGLVPNRVLKLTLAANSFKVLGYQVLDWNHPDFGEPTLGTIVGPDFYYVANSSWSAYTKEMELNPESLPEIKIIAVSLD